jgi:hypothetical protein
MYFTDTGFSITYISHSVSYSAAQTEEIRSEILTGYRQTLSVQLHILGSVTYMVNFKDLLNLYHKYNHTLNNTYTVERS